MFEVFEHTADVGLRLRAPDLNGLFAEAGRGLFALMVENAAQARPELRVAVELKAGDLDDLLHDWMSELLYQFAGQHRVLCQFDVEVRDNALRATVAGEPLDLARHALAQEVKAVTYHQLAVRRTEQGWEAQVILDI